MTDRGAGSASIGGSRRAARHALMLWLAWFAVAITLNGTILFLRGADLRAWTYSPAKSVIGDVLVYGLLFLVAPLILVRGVDVLRRPPVIVSLGVILLGLALRTWVRPAAAVIVPAIVFLHGRIDLGPLGLRSRGWRGDLLSVLALAALAGIPALLAPPAGSGVLPAMAAGLDRLFLNPASSIENLFYFGFLTERLSTVTGRFTAPLIGLLYVAHEMTNPEYWYEGMTFPLVFLGVTIAAAFYLWRRSLPVVWLADGLGRMIAWLV